MPKNRDATGIGKSKLDAYRCGSRGSRSRDCSKNVIVSHKRRDISDSWSRHVLNPCARFRVDDAQDGLTGAVGRCYVIPVVSRVVPDLIATADLLDHVDDTPIDGVHDVRSAARRYEQALKWPEHDAIHAAGAAGYPIFLGYPHASGIDDSHVWRRRRHSHEEPVKLGVPPWLFQTCRIGQFNLAENAVGVCRNERQVRRNGSIICDQDNPFDWIVSEFVGTAIRRTAHADRVSDPWRTEVQVDFLQCAIAIPHPHDVVFRDKHTVRPGSVRDSGRTGRSGKPGYPCYKYIVYFVKYVYR